MQACLPTGGYLDLVVRAMDINWDRTITEIAGSKYVSKIESG
jgi:hypothetical protein